MRMDHAVRLLEHVIHCLDASEWPFKSEEILAPLVARSFECLDGVRNRVHFTAAEHPGTEEAL